MSNRLRIETTEKKTLYNGETRTDIDIFDDYYHTCIECKEVAEDFTSLAPIKKFEAVVEFIAQNLQGDDIFSALQSVQECHNGVFVDGEWLEYLETEPTLDCYL